MRTPILLQRAGDRLLSLVVPALTQPVAASEQWRETCYCSGDAWSMERYVRTCVLHSNGTVSCGRCYYAGPC